MCVYRNGPASPPWTKSRAGSVGLVDTDDCRVEPLVWDLAEARWLLFPAWMNRASKS
jgi:hypothetical protein